MPPERRVTFRGLDLYSLYTSVEQVLRYLEDVDPDAAAVARHRYGCLTPFQGDAGAYGRAAISGRYRACEPEVLRTLEDLLRRRIEAAERDGDRLLDAVQNARLVANAERYYRVMYYGGARAWNLRDRHMFDTLAALLERRPDEKIVVWAHNSHVGDSRATEMAARGEHNLGTLCRTHLSEPCYVVGFGTHAGTVAAARNWGEEMQIMEVRPSHEGSYERLCHEAEPGRFLLPLRDRPELARPLSQPRIERAIGVIYRPETELMSHYFEAVLPHQFDEYIWFDRSRAITPLTSQPTGEIADTYPFGV